MASMNTLMLSSHNDVVLSSAWYRLSSRLLASSSSSTSPTYSTMKAPAGMASSDTTPNTDARLDKVELVDRVETVPASNTQAAVGRITNPTRCSIQAWAGQC
ncbi:hypothetical protein V7S43_007228 [Phytophthora oleae]|uniref:Uncharacterized protein n=1 Tax=Phytophthora oleae TaxID=2107226 RepID=A0ABD3FPV6_9STRA